VTGIVRPTSRAAEDRWVEELRDRRDREERATEEEALRNARLVLTKVEDATGLRGEHYLNLIVSNHSAELAGTERRAGPDSVS
jgi:hypothetical protein